MPAEPLSPTQRELIRQWVMYGAPMTDIPVHNENPPLPIFMQAILYHVLPRLPRLPLARVSKSIWERYL